MIALPNFGNSVINLLKESALAYTIGLIDLLGRTNLIIAKNYGAYGIELYVACLLIYWGLSIIIEQAFLRMESYLGRPSEGVRRKSWNWTYHLCSMRCPFF